MQVIDRLTNFEDWNAARFGQNFVALNQLRVRLDHNGLHLQELEGAMTRGKICRQYTLYAPNLQTDALWEVLSSIEYDLTTLHKTVKRKALDVTRNTSGYGQVKTEIAGTTIALVVNDEASSRTFSPFKLDAITPLKRVPDKWRIPEAVRVLMTGQIKLAHTGHRLTDDYQFDNACNFSRGKIHSPMHLGSEILRSPNGWWINSTSEPTRINLNCHHLESHHIDVNLDARYQFEAHPQQGTRWLNLQVHYFGADVVRGSERITEAMQQAYNKPISRNHTEQDYDDVPAFAH